MNIVQTLTALSPGLTASFLGVGGVEPYTYEVIAGGAGGTIDGDGNYIAPDVTGVDIIQVTDSDLVPTVLTAQIKILTPHELVLDIVQNEMSLQDDQLTLYNQKFNIPNDDRVYFSLAIVSTKVLGNNRKNVGDESIQSTNFYDMITLEISSKSIDSLNRREELVMALGSDYAQSQQEANSFRIGKIPSSFVNLSRQEGNALLYAYGLTLTLSYFKKKITNIKYFDTFQNPVIETNS